MRGASELGGKEEGGLFISCARATRRDWSVWFDGLSGSSGEIFGPANQKNETDKIEQTDLPLSDHRTTQIDEIDQMN